MRTIIKKEGVLALWGGLTPQLLGVGHVAIQFPLYEDFKTRFARQNVSAGKPKELALWQLICASTISKCCASVATYPHEVLRARFYSTKYRSNDLNLRSAIQTIAKEEGVMGFYKGLSANLFRVAPSCAITFTSYELFLRLLHRKSL